MRVADIFEGAGIEHRQVCQLPRLKTSEICPVSNGFSTIYGRDAERIVVRHAPARQRPQFPVGTEAVQLTVAANVPTFSAGG